MQEWKMTDLTRNLS